MTAADVDDVGARVVILHNKWRTVWRLSVERKKLLQDTLDHLLEVKTQLVASCGQL